MPIANMEEVDYFDAKIRRWRIGASTYLAWPERGARLMNWNISLADGAFRDVVHWPDIEGLEAFTNARGGNPILFPFCGRTFDAGKIHHWKDTAETSRPMPMHGLARQGLFDLINIDATGFTARFQPDLEAHQAYPYKYNFDVTYRFAEKSFIVELRLSNQDTQPIPWSAGHHFYFAMPWTEGTTLDDYQLDIPASKSCRHINDGSLQQLGPPTHSAPLSNPELIDLIRYGLSDPAINCHCAKDETALEIEVGTDEHPNPEYAVVTWKEFFDSPYYCIEPWMGPPNSPENGIGLHEVAPGESQAFSVTARI